MDDWECFLWADRDRLMYVELSLQSPLFFRLLHSRYTWKLKLRLHQARTSEGVPSRSCDVRGYPACCGHADMQARDQGNRKVNEEVLQNFSFLQSAAGAAKVETAFDSYPSDSEVSSPVTLAVIHSIYWWVCYVI